MDVFLVFIIIFLQLTILGSLLYLIAKSSQPVISIDEKSAQLIAERLANLTLKESNVYDSINEALKQSSHIEDYYLNEIIELIKENH